MARRFWRRLLADFERRIELEPYDPEASERYAKTELLPLVQRRLSRHPKDLEHLKRLLSVKPDGYVVGYVFREIEWMPEDLYEPMLAEAINDPAESRGFVEACIKMFGHYRVNETLLDVFERGSNREKVGVVHSLYWAEVRLVFRGSVGSYEIEDATPESRAAYESLQELRTRRDHLFLHEFVNNVDVDVQNVIIAHLTLRVAAYPREMHPLVHEAIQIARNHESDYIRHRVEIQLGSGGGVQQASIEFGPE